MIYSIIHKFLSKAQEKQKQVYGLTDHSPVTRDTYMKSQLRFFMSSVGNLNSVQFIHKEK